MKVLVDTSIWSLALRRSRAGSAPEVAALRRLIADYRVALIGPVRQEVLSGIRDARQFATLRRHLAAFPDTPLREDDFEQAASFFKTCRAAGVQGSNTDFLICSVAAHRGWTIFTTDHDFSLVAAHVPVRLHGM